jgi:hypothetical protein
MQKKVYSWDELYAGVLVGRPNGETVDVDGDAKTVTVHVRENRECIACINVQTIGRMDDTQGAMARAAHPGHDCAECDDTDDYDEYAEENAEWGEPSDELCGCGLDVEE